MCEYYQGIEKENCRTIPGLEKNQRMTRQRIRMKGIRWTAFSANRKRALSFLATWELGLYMGSWSSEVVSLRVGEGDDDENSSETRLALDDLCIFSIMMARKKEEDDELAFTCTGRRGGR